MSMDDFNKLRTLNLSIADVNYGSVGTYANGNNHMKILIKLTATNNFGTELNATNDDFINSLNERGAELCQRYQ